jgi:hypothetical protein
MLPILILRKMPELTQHQWKLIFTAVSSYRANHPLTVPCYKGMNEDLSLILDIIHPYANLDYETTDA